MRRGAGMRTVGCGNRVGAIPPPTGANLVERASATAMANKQALTLPTLTTGQGGHNNFLPQNVQFVQDWTPQLAQQPAIPVAPAAAYSPYAPQTANMAPTTDASDGTSAYTPGYAPAGGSDITIPWVPIVIGTIGLGGILWFMQGSKRKR